MRLILVDTFEHQNKTLSRYLAARQYLDSLRPKLSASELDAILRQIEEEELKGAYIIPIRLLTREQLIQHYNKIEDKYKESFTPYVLRKSKWHRLKIPRVANEYELPKNWKSIVRRAEELQKQGILSAS